MKRYGSIVLLLVFAVSTVQAVSIWGKDSFQKGSIKEWPQWKVEAFYREMAARRAQDLERPIRRSNIISGNQIRTLIFDFGSIGAPGREPSLEWPVYSAHGYGYEFGPLVGVEVPIDSNGHFLPYIDDGTGVMVVDTGNPVFDTTFYIISDGLIDGGAAGDSEELDPGSGLPWGWEPIEGFANPDSDAVAVLSSPGTWPPEWNAWPGTYQVGASTADEASMYVMDDRFNQEFAFYPFPEDHDIGGMGLRVEVRIYQWSNPLANDAIFFVYEITNTSNNDYEKVVFGMFGDPHIGGSNDYSDDWANFDKNVNMVYGYDADETGQWGGATGYLGYKFLESPGNAYDGIDNDGDGMIDESMFNGIDDDNDWDPERDDVGIDGIGPDDPSYPGPDEGEADGIPNAGDPLDPLRPGEPNFETNDLDEADQIGLTSFNAYQYGTDMIRNDLSIWNRMRPYTLVGEDNAFTDIAQNADNIFLYGSGYFPLRAGDTQRFSVALLMGEDEGDLFHTAEIVQKIYDSGYSFAKAPNKPVASAVSGDREVVIYWDDSAENSWDPAYGYDFEGYSIYRSTDPGFNEVYTITDMFGNSVLWEPLVRFDLVDGIQGESAVGISGMHFDLGSETGLVHSFRDSTVYNGITYYYAVVSYDYGDTTGQVEIPPSECTKTILKDAYSGVVTTDVNTIVVTPNAPSPGVIEPELTELDHVSGPGTGDIELEIMDATRIRDNVTYTLSFSDTSLAAEDTLLNVLDETVYLDTFELEPGDWYTLPHNHIDKQSFVLATAEGTELVLGAHYELNTLLGKVHVFDNSFNGTAVTFVTEYQYYPIWKSFYFAGEDANPVFDGVRVYVTDQVVDLDHENIGWIEGESNWDYTHDVWDAGTSNQGFKYPHDYLVVFDSINVATSLNGKDVPFYILDVTDPENVDTAAFYVASEPFDFDGDKIGIFSEPVMSVDTKTWEIIFNMPDTTGGVAALEPTLGDIFQLKTNKPFSPLDVYEFTTVAASWDRDEAKSKLDEIAVVPNPYVATAIWEPSSGFATGSRGERRISFIKLPPECTIRIFTIVGELVDTIEHSHASDFWDGSETWDLLSKDNMEIAFGVYVYHVEAPGVGEKIGKFALIK